MVSVGEIYRYLDELAGFSQMPDYDNSGLLVGDMAAGVRAVMTCLDCTADVIAQAKKRGAGLIVSHHPPIFQPLKQIESGGVIYGLIREGIAVIALHIPIDEVHGGANYWLCEKLGLEPAEPFLPRTGTDGSARCSGWIGKTPAPLPAGDFAAGAARSLGCGVCYNGGGRPVRTAVVCGGSGKDFVEDFFLSGHDCYISSEFRHDQYLAAGAAGVTLIDGTHFATEIHIPRILTQKLAARFPEAGFFTADERSPVTVT